MSYNPWPFGDIDESLQRPELSQIKKMGYEFDDPRDVIDIFEKKVAKFAGSKYAVAVDCCTHAIDLCLTFKSIISNTNQLCLIPRNTYISVPMSAVLNPFCELKFTDEKWEKYYRIGDTGVVDAATWWEDGMYIPDTLFCISFQRKKIIPIGRGGMILTNDPLSYHWLKINRYDGRDMEISYDGDKHIKDLGYHYYMTPEDAARGIILMDNIKKVGWKDWSSYPDTEKMLKNVLK
ncbi:MAG TPA: DegT/DnrJ/EryC1/StrS family aminotransferase [Smithella sp.]|nr:DegT/DnrJ/EryC1/StrS family aminotransferase [Smithella sp.]